MTGSVSEVALGPECFATDCYDWWRGLVDLVAGKHHGILVATYSSGDEVDVEILGSLPRELRRNLKRAIPYWEPVRRGQLPWSLCKTTWCPRHDGKGPRYAIPDMVTLLGLLAQRRETLSGESR